MVNSEQETILIVDDTKENLRLLAGMLTENGYVVRPALNGQTALLSAFAEPPDLILLDIMMPDMNGYEVCDRLKVNELTKEIPVIFISASYEVFDKVKGFAIGAVDYITKPFHLEEVLARVQTHLALRSLQKKLQEKNAELSQTVSKLQVTQTQLIESEKMAALGNLVAGVAHEINTPIGTGITVASTLENETKAFLEVIEQGQLKKSVLIAYLSKAERCSQLILSNLQRAGTLVQSFKQVAVDQTQLDRYTFNVLEYIEKTLVTLTPHIQQNKHSIRVSGDETIRINSYPGAFSQIVTNLVINSITHAYQPGEEGNLRFEIIQKNDILRITYSDDGCGVTESSISKIYEPFFTTARSKGGSGLGLHIVYNLVTQTLQGTIRCETGWGKALHEHYGLKFVIELPIEPEG